MQDMLTHEARKHGRHVSTLKPKRLWHVGKFLALRARNLGDSIYPYIYKHRIYLTLFAWVQIFSYIKTLTL